MRRCEWIVYVSFLIELQEWFLYDKNLVAKTLLKPVKHYLSAIPHLSSVYGVGILLFENNHPDNTKRGQKHHLTLAFDQKADLHSVNLCRTSAFDAEMHSIMTLFMSPVPKDRILLQHQGETGSAATCLT